MPLDAIVLIVRQTQFDPVPLTVALIGREGMVGCPALLDMPAWTHDAIVLTGGEAIALPVSALRDCSAAHDALRRLLLRVVHNNALQLAQNVVANLGHSAERRVARWLAMLDDRTQGELLTVTHEQLAQLLNVRRATVTDLLHVLEGELLIRNTRGRIEVRDRAGLRARAEQSYGLSEDDYRQLIAGFASAEREP